jgi:hypothetical protein
METLNILTWVFIALTWILPPFIKDKQNSAFLRITLAGTAFGLALAQVIIKFT